MSERFKTRDITQELDNPVIASFAGLSSASLNSTADVIYADKLTNCYVDKNGEIRRRAGSNAMQGLSWSLLSGNSHEVHQFRYDNITYVLVRTGIQLSLFFVDTAGNYYPTCFFNNVFRDASGAEKASYATVVDGNQCHILIATASTQLISFTILSRRAVVNGKSGDIVYFDIENFPIANNITADNSVMFTDAGFFVDSVSVTQAAAAIAYTGTTAGIATVSIGDGVRLHAYYWLRYADAQYLPGLYFYNTQVRRNAVAADVNVQIPVELADNPLYGEPPMNLDIHSIQLSINNNATPTFSNWMAGSNKPVLEDDWQFSDGSYLPASPNLFTKRTPAYVSYGALQAVATNTTVFMHRFRRVMVGGGRSNPPEAQDLEMYYDAELADKTLANVGISAIVTGSNLAHYWAALNWDSVSGYYEFPGVNLAAVVELVFTNVDGAGSAAVANIANMGSRYPFITIGNGYCVPLYGYYALADVRNHKYPNQVLAVGNRVVLTGKDNLIGISHADWTFRGFSFNNFQVSSFDFNTNSAFYVRLTQGVSRITALTTVNGVMAIGTDAGIFRVSGETANLPPTADSAIVSKVSSEVVPDSECFMVYENKVFYASRNGFFQLEYSQEVDELQNRSMSSHISNYFTGATPSAITFSQTLRSFVIGFMAFNSLLVFNVDSLTWYTIHLSSTLRPRVNQTFDGFVLKTVNDSADNYILICTWDSSADTDLRYLGGWSAGVFPALSVTITEADTDVSALSTPAEMMQSLAPPGVRILQGYGQNTARVVGQASVQITEHSGGKQPMPFYAYFVSKAFFDSFFRSHRVRNLHLLLVGSGQIQTTIAFPTDDYRDRIIELNTYSLGEVNPYAGEPLLNNEYVTRNPVGDTKNLRIRLLGISEAWQLCIRFLSGVRLAGLQFTSSRKSTRRAH